MTFLVVHLGSGLGFIIGFSEHICVRRGYSISMISGKGDVCAFNLISPLLVRKLPFEFHEHIKRRFVNRSASASSTHVLAIHISEYIINT